MIDNFFAMLFNKYVEKVLKEKKDKRAKSKEAEPFVHKDSTDESLKKVVSALSDMDFSRFSKIRESLKKDLMEHMEHSAGKPDGNTPADEELDLEQLDNVAGGIDVRYYEIEDKDKNS